MSNEAYWREKYLELLNQKEPQRTWVGLTDEERHSAFFDKDGMARDYEDYAWAIEAKLKEKNFD